MNRNGKDLSIIIELNEKYPAWVFFSCYYSIIKKLPDAEIIAVLKRTSAIEGYTWLKKVNIPIFFQNSENLGSRDIKLKIPSTCIAIRSLNETLNLGPSDSDWTIFINIEKLLALTGQMAPFGEAVKTFGKENLTIDELSVLKFWDSCYFIYNTINAK